MAMRRTPFSLLLFALLVASACRDAPRATVVAPVAPDLAAFDDMTAGSGIAFTYRNGQEAGHYAILETLGGGVGLIDFDRDGLLDIFFTGGGSFDGPDKKTIRGAVNRLYRNRGQWKFEDVTERVGLGTAGFYSHGVAIADYDSDGWPDILVTGYDGLTLWRNDGGKRFVDVSRSVELPENPDWCTSAAWGDLNGDGFPELYVCRYVNWSWNKHPPCQGAGGVKHDVCTPKAFDAIPHLLFVNEAGPKGRVLRECGERAGLRVPPRPDGDYGKGLGVLIADLNGDSRPDIYVANDTTDNLLYLNEGGTDIPKLREVGLKLGVARDGGGTPNGSMGVDAADYDGSGRPSLWVTNYENEIHALYRAVEKDGRRFFQFSSQSAGTAAIGQLYVGFGTAFVDHDGDGWEDIVVSNGHVLRHPARGSVAQMPVLFRNTGDGRFEPMSSRGGMYFRSPHQGRGLAVGDLDNDGRPDLVVSHVNEPVALLRNSGNPAGNWLSVELAAHEGRDLVGAKVTVDLGGRKLTRFVKGGGSYLSSSEQRMHVGIGSSSVQRVVVEWPRGAPRIQELAGPFPSKVVKIKQGDTGKATR